MSTTDPAAGFTAAYDAHFSAIAAFALRRIADPHAAADIAAETFATAWRRWDESPHDVRPWLYGIARGLLANERRAGARRAGLRERLAGTPPQAPAASEALDESSPAIIALRGLSARDQEVLALAAWEDLTPAQIATVLGCTPNTASARLHRARTRFAAALDAAPHQQRIFA